MKKSAIFKIITFIAIFIAVAYITNRVGNGSIDSLSAEMSNATLPVVYMEYENALVNRLHGYANAVDTALLRDTVMPLTKEKQLSFWIGDADIEHDSYSYELRAMDGSLIEDGDVENLREEQGYLKCDSTIRMDLKPNQEYCYTLLLARDGNTIRYYTRVMVEEDCHVSELLQFTKQLHAETLVKNEEDSLLIRKLEPNAQGNNDDLAKVDIHSDYDTVTYAGMAPVVISQVVPAIQEINVRYCIFKLDFVLAAGDETVTNHYNVTEYYKVSYADAQTRYLLDYQRSQNELYHYNNVNTAKNWFKLGVGRTEQMEYLTSDGEKRVAFVREGQLWYYDYAKTNVIRIFGFWQEDYLNINNTYDQHDIRLISMDDDGNIAFAVSGYMNRGNHEGHTGIAVYQYTAESNRTEELLFVELGLPYEQLSLYTDKFMFLNDKHIFFYYLQDTIYKIDTEGGLTVVAEHVPAADFAVSGDKSRIAYPANEDISQNTQITIMDLQTEETTNYSVSGQECAMPIGFVDRDFVCGRAAQADVVRYADGSLLRPIYKLEVMDMNKNILKEYEEPGMYLMNTYTKGSDIYFERAERIGSSYQVKDQDFITYKETDNTEKIEVIYRYSQASLNLMYMVFPSYIYVKSVPRLLMTKEIIRAQSIHVEGVTAQDKKGFYVYNTGGLTGVYSVAAGALKEALDTRGLVLNQQGARVWQNTSLPEFFTIDDQIQAVQAESRETALAACVQMALAYNNIQMEQSEIEAYGESAEALFDEQLGRSGLRLADVPLETVLYYLVNGVPVIARLDEAHYVLITSFNNAAIRYIDPLLGESVRLDRVTFENRVKAAGDLYITYLP